MEHTQTSPYEVRFEFDGAFFRVELLPTEVCTWCDEHNEANGGHGCAVCHDSGFAWTGAEAEVKQIFGLDYSIPTLPGRLHRLAEVVGEWLSEYRLTE